MPAFERIENNSWKSCATAMGPFKGLQGGAVAGLMVSELEEEAKESGLGFAVSASIEFLRPTGMGLLRTQPTTLRRGKRVSILSNSVFEGDHKTAQATVCFIQHIDMPTIETPTEQPFDPSGLPKLPPRKAIHGKPWMMDTFEVRPSPNGIIWFRYTSPMLENIGPLARVLGPADWTHGLDRPKEPKLADPNVNLQVVVSRRPAGDYIGIQPNTTWLPTGIGMGDGVLFDETGPFGRVTMAVALTPLG